MTTRAQILALAADYDAAPKGTPRDAARRALLDAVELGRVQCHGQDTGAYRGPAGDGMDHVAVLRAWVAASRRAAKNPAPRLGRPPSDRVHRLDVPATEATVQAVRAHAKRTGRKAATVAGDLLEEATKALRGEGGSDE